MVSVADFCVLRDFFKSMTLFSSSFSSTLAFAAVLLCWVAGATAADDAKSTKAGPQRPPLQLKVDRAQIDRDAPVRASYASVVKQASGSVAYVYSTKQVRGQDLTPFLNDPMFRRFFGGPEGREGREGRAPDRTQRGLGSGVVITRDGYIITNNHVVEGADEVKVSIGESSKRYDAKVIGADSLADIAVLKIEADGLSTVTFGDSDQLLVGDTVLALGNPFGLGPSVSRGIVSAVSRGNLGIEAIEDFIQTDAAINPGNSGGALIDNAGRLIGINTAILSRSGGFAGVGFAIPINLVRASAEQIVNTGRVDRGFLGVAPQTITPELAAQFGTDQGALIAEVTTGSPAEQAGLKSGDVVTKINNTEIREPRQLLLTVSQLAPGTTVQVHYLRDGKTNTATAKLARRPDQTGASDGTQGATQNRGVLNGVSVGEITSPLRQQLQIPSRIQGAIVTQIQPDSPAAKQGLREGDIILELDRKPVKNAEEAVALSEQIPGPKVTLLIWRDGRSLYTVIDESKK